MQARYAKMGLVPGLAVLCLLVGCASSPARWYLNGKSLDQFNGDDQLCQSFAQQTVDVAGQAAAGNQAQGNHYAQMGAGIAGIAGLFYAAASAEKQYVNCMRARGYTPAK